MNGNHSIGLRRLNEDRRRYPSIFEQKFNRIGENLSAYAAHSVCRETVRPLPQIECSRGCRADDRCVVPGELAQRFWKLLKPAVVSEATIVDCRIGTENYFKCSSAAWWLACGSRRWASSLRAKCLQRKRGVCDKPIV